MIEWTPLGVAATVVAAAVIIYGIVTALTYRMQLGLHPDEDEQLRTRWAEAAPPAPAVTVDEAAAVMRARLAATEVRHNVIDADKLRANTVDPDRIRRHTFDARRDLYPPTEGTPT